MKSQTFTHYAVVELLTVSMMIVVLDHRYLPHYKSPTVELVELENECSSYNFRSLPSLCQNYQSLWKFDKVV